MVVREILKQTSNEMPCFCSNLMDISISFLKEKYWIEVEFKTASFLSLWRKYSIDYFSNEEISKQLAYLCSILNNYPDDILKKAHIKKIYVLKKISDKPTWNSIWWLQYNWELFINFWDNPSKLNHEIFHRLDFNDWNDDNEYWGKKFPSSCKNEINFSESSNDEIAWYANSYWCEWWMEEDQATVAEYLLDDAKRKRLLERAKKDDVLRKKIMVITWSFFDSVSWKFTRDLTKKEYTSEFWTNNYEYYAKWSLQNWVIQMWYEYWNK